MTGGFFALVLGTSQAEISGWAAPATIAWLIAVVFLLTTFVIIQMRSRTPLLPLRIVLDRVRDSALIALLLSSAGLFTTFLFLPFYLQSTLGYPQLMTGLAFLPVPIALVASAVFIGPVLTRRIGVRHIVPLGLALAGAGALLLVRLGTTADYLTDLLPGLVLIGAGIGLVIATATGSATAGVVETDAGAAAVQSYATAYAGVGVLFLVGAALTFLIHPRRSPSA